MGEGRAVKQVLSCQLRLPRVCIVGNSISGIFMGIQISVQ